jgi:hypothetical protein
MALPERRRPLKPLGRKPAPKPDPEPGPEPAKKAAKKPAGGKKS